MPLNKETKPKVHTKCFLKRKLNSYNLVITKSPIQQFVEEGLMIQVHTYSTITHIYI